MRPVVTGSTPSKYEEKKNHIQTHSSESVQLKVYQYARGPLIETLGQYCSYCEMRLETSLAVEHKMPKSEDSTLLAVYKNFLLACTNCNSTKSNKVFDEVLWPDEDNTWCAFDYDDLGMVSVYNDDEKWTELAENTIKMAGLDKKPSTDSHLLKASDRRVQNRQGTWKKADRALKSLQRISERVDDLTEATISAEKEYARLNELVPSTIIGMGAKQFDLKLCNEKLTDVTGALSKATQIQDDTRNLIRDLALASGYWSVWMTVFRDYIDFQKVLIKSFPGTYQHVLSTNVDRKNQFGFVV